MLVFQNVLCMYKILASQPPTPQYLLPRPLKYKGLDNAIFYINEHKT